MSDETLSEGICADATFVPKASSNGPNFIIILVHMTNITEEQFLDGTILHNINGPIVETWNLTMSNTPVQQQNLVQFLNLMSCLRIEVCRIIPDEIIKCKLLH